MSAKDLESVQEKVSTIFDQVQLSAANHRKNCVSLYKLHVQTSKVTESAKNGQSIKLTGERTFSDAILTTISCILVIKKGVVQADRVVRFIGSYAKFMGEKAQEDDSDTLLSRFVSRLLKWLFQGLEARDKTVRFRSIQLVAEVVVHIGEIDEDTYESLRSSLVQRLEDKESMIRAHAVIALAKLCGSEESDETETPTLQLLLDTLSQDPAAEVRRCALMNIPFNSVTLELILDRMRDVDTLTRKLVYSSALSTRLSHPKQLTIAQREQVVRNGLGDREPAVRLAAAKLIVNWLDLFLLEEQESQKEGEGKDFHIGGLIRFLQAFDLVGSGIDVAADALASIFLTRQDILDSIVFSEALWRDMSAEFAVLARVFTHYCLSNNLRETLEASKLPVVTAFAFYVQESYNSLVQLAQEEQLAEYADIDEQEEARDFRESQLHQLESVLGELLRIATTLDYADEIGRRKMFSIVRDMLAQDSLPESLIERCMDVLYEITPDERELIRIVVEVIVELRDDAVETVLDGLGMQAEESMADMSQIQREPSMRHAKERHEMSHEEAIQADAIDLRCLWLCTSVLERVKGTFEDNAVLDGVVATLIIPSVRRKEQVLREKALVALALCCLIAKKMALSGPFKLFLNQVQGSPPSLKCKALQCAFDLLVTYDAEFFDPTNDNRQHITSFLLHLLDFEENDAVQALLCVGLSKLLLSGLLNDGQVLSKLLIKYVQPATMDNQELRQCLSYFFPVYCYSSPVNQSRMRSIFTNVFDLAAQLFDEREEEDMIAPYHLGLQMLDWTDPQKCAGHNETHLDLAADILAALYDTERSVEHQKSLCQLLTNLQMPTEADNHTLMKIQLLQKHLNGKNTLDDSASERYLERFKARLRKLYNKQLDTITDQQYADEDFRQLFEFIGVDMPEPTNTPAQCEPHASGDDDEDEQEQPNNSQEEEVIAGASGLDDERSPFPSPKQKKKGRANGLSSPQRATRSSIENVEPHITSSIATSAKFNSRQSEKEASSEPSSSEEEARPITPPPKPKRTRSPASKSVLASPTGKKRSRVKSPPKPKQTNGKSVKAKAIVPQKTTRGRTRSTRSSQRQVKSNNESSDPDSEP